MEFYRFQPINKLTLQNLINQKNWVADPYLFNDPFEFSHQGNSYFDNDGKLKYYQGSDFEKLERIRSKIIEYGVVCYSKNYENVLLWSHYADNHSGMCLVFDLDEQKDEKLYEINYTNEYPRIDLSNDAAEHLEILKIVTTKPKSWSYEEEYRQVYIKKGFLHDYEGKLVEIIFGSRTKLEDIKIVANLARSHNKDIKISRAKPQPDTYRLALSSIPTGNPIPDHWKPNL